MRVQSQREQWPDRCAWARVADDDDRNNGLLPGTQALNDTLLQQFPGADIGGYREDSAYPDEHPAGKALDFMTSDPNQAQSVMDTAWNGGADYAIWNNEMHYPGGGTAPYTGDNPHTDHVHIHHPGTGDGSSAGGGAGSSAGTGITPSSPSTPSGGGSSSSGTPATVYDPGVGGPPPSDVQDTSKGFQTVDFYPSNYKTTARSR